MKKILSIVLIFSLVLSFGAITSAAPITVKINGEVQKYDQPPVIKNGTTLVPMRAIFESLGAIVKWDNATQTVTGTKDDITVRLTIGSSNPMINSDLVYLSQPAEIINGATMVPLRFIGEALGADVKWDSKSQTIEITYDDNKIGTRKNPAGIGEKVTLDRDDWLYGKSKLEFELKEVVTGDAAWTMVSTANMFNDEPASGKEYVLAKFRIKVISAEKDPVEINHAMFDSINSKGVVDNQFISVAGLDPDLRTELYVGAEYEGWTYFLVEKGDDALIAFDRGKTSEVWFKIRDGYDLLDKACECLAR